MRFFRRDPKSGGREAIASFWAWWDEARHRVAASIAAGQAGSLVGELSGHVDAIDRRLAWELSAGRSSQHALIVTPEGDPAVRALALEWRAAAPEPDGTWEYHASRQAGPLGHLAMDGVDIDLSAYRAISSWDENRQRVDVRLWHPTMSSAPAAASIRAAYLFLDNLLGEDGVERWVGTIDLLEAETVGRSPDELRAEVERRSAEASGESWVLAEGDGGLYLVNLAVKPIDHPWKHWHVVVTVDRGLEELSNSTELPELDAAEDRLVEAMTSAESIHLGHVTDRKRRRIHFMCADGDRGRAVGQAWADQERHFGPRVDVEDDPSWSVRSELGL